MLDLKDRKILSLLDQNARMPVTKIAKKIRLDKGVVRYRIERLEKNVVRSYYPVINVHKLGYLTARIYFTFVNMNRRTITSLIRCLDKDLRAGSIFSVDGPYDLGVLLWEPSVYSLEEKLRSIKKLFGTYIERQDISIFTKFNQYPRKYLPLSERSVVTIQEETPVSVDEDDRRLLRVLSKDARISSVGLSKKLNIPQRTALYKLRSLEKKRIILGYRADVDVAYLQKENYFLEVYTDEPLGIETFAYSNECVVYSLYSLSDADIELEVEVDSKQELLVFIDKLKEQFHVRKIKYWSTLNYYKLNYFP